MKEQRLLQALAGEATSRIPFWFMRQAGRYLPEYLACRKEAGSFLDLCFNPGFATEVTLQPIRRFDMDAAILFSDILVVPYALGQKVEFLQGEGPKLSGYREAGIFKDIPEDTFHARLLPVYEAVKNIRAQLPEDKTLIGFAGAPWTVACYMVQGYGDKEFASVRHYAYTHKEDMDALIDVLTERTAQYLLQQIRSGVDCVQLFDSWAGLLPEALFERWVIRPARRIAERIRQEYPHVPMIGFPKGAGLMLARYAEETGVEGLGIDQFTPLSESLKATKGKVTLQGNLDPAVLLAGGKALEDAVMHILHTAEDHPFIFNLGHGVIKETPVEHVARVSELVKSYERQESRRRIV